MSQADLLRLVVRSLEDAEMRIRQRVLDLEFYVSSPEDTILAKLRWSRLSGESSKSFTDALRVYEVQQGLLDTAYLEEWAASLGVADLLNRIRSEAEPA